MPNNSLSMLENAHQINTLSLLDIVSWYIIRNSDDLSYINDANLFTPAGPRVNSEEALDFLKQNQKSGFHLLHPFSFLKYIHIKTVSYDFIFLFVCCWYVMLKRIDKRCIKHLFFIVLYSHFSNNFLRERI